MITDVDGLYFEWLMEQIGAETEQLEKLCLMLHANKFTRRIGHDINREVQGRRLRHRFMDEFSDLDIDPRKLNKFEGKPCTWLEMLLALSESLDFIYDGGVQGRFLEMIDNLGLSKILDSPLDGRYDEVDQDLVDITLYRVDNNKFSSNGHGGLFPLEQSNHPDQRRVEIWEQHAAYFREKLEGVMWTSISLELSERRKGT